MQFREVLKIHRGAVADGSHPDILGDAFLMRDNPVYRRIKARARETGAVFRPATTDYLLLPFNQLDRILASKEIPYVPNAKLMEDVETKYPGIFSLEEMPMPESYHLHEAAHVVAADCCRQLRAEGANERILETILCESFANTVDALACSYADSVEHQLFLKSNCYMAPVEATLALVQRVRASLGERVVVELLLHSYVYANFLVEEVPDDLLEETVVTDGVKLTKKLAKDCRALSQLGQRLDPLFRVQTTSNFLHLAGFRGEIYDLLAFDFRAISEKEDFRRVRDAMIAVLQVQHDP